MNTYFESIILQATGAKKLFEMQNIQELWSGYGSIVRYRLEGCDIGSVVVKHIRLPQNNTHPRGWNTDISHERKIKSYQVETAWYQNWSSHCDHNAYLPTCFAIDSHNDETLLVLEDLKQAGFSTSKSTVSLEQPK